MKNLFALTLAFGALSAVYAAPFTAGNLVVTQIGADGRSSALTNGSTDVVIKEYTPAGTLVQTITLPVDGSGLTLTNSGTATSEGHISFGGNRFVIAGYWSTLGVASIVASTSVAAPRMVGLIDLNGNVDLTTRLTDAYNANNIRMATFDGTNIYTAGTAATTGGNELTNGIRQATLGATTSTQISGTPFGTPANTRTVNIYDGKLYFSTGSANFNGVNTFEVALPTAAAGASNLAGMSDVFVTTTVGTTNVFPSTYDFAFADANTLYITEDNGNSGTPASGPERGGVYKVTFDAGQNKWVLAYVLKAGLPGFTTGTQTRGARSIAVTKNSSGQNVLYVVSGEQSGATTAVYQLTDTGSSAAFTQVVRSATNTNFRGVEIVPATSGGSRTITGSINLGGDWAGSATNANNITVPFDINDGAATVNASLTFVNGVASYSITVPGGVGAGPVKLAAKFTTFLRKVRGSVALGSSGQDFTMVNGNVDGDTEVSILDYIELSTAYGSVEGSGAYGTGTADLDKDGEVSILDYIILSTTYGQADEA
jgi:hypothetical protein